MKNSHSDLTVHLIDIVLNRLWLQIPANTKDIRSVAVIFYQDLTLRYLSSYIPILSIAKLDLSSNFTMRSSELSDP